MKLLRLLSFVALASLTSAMWPQDREHKDLCPIVFDAPGAGSGAGLGTFVQGITSTGSVAGYTIDDNYVFHGFIRTRDGAFTIVDMPQAGSKSTQGTLIFAMKEITPISIPHAVGGASRVTRGGVRHSKAIWHQ